MLRVHFQRRNTEGGLAVGLAPETTVVVFTPVVVAQDGPAALVVYGEPLAGVTTEIGVKQVVDVNGSVFVSVVVFFFLSLPLPLPPLGIGIGIGWRAARLA